jgi:hypothetical protein
MPKSPITASPSSERQVAPGILADARFDTSISPETFGTGETQTKAIEGIADQAREHFEKQKAIADYAVVQKAKIAASQPIDTSLRNLQKAEGDNAVAQLAQLPKTLDDAKSDTLKGLQNQTQVNEFNRWEENNRKQVLDEANRHVADVRNLAIHKASAILIQQNIDKIALNRKNPDVLANLEKNTMEEVDKNLRLVAGVSPDSASEESRKQYEDGMKQQRSNFLLEVGMNKLAFNDVKGVNNLIESRVGDMTTDDVDKLKRGIQSQYNRIDGLREADKDIRENPNLLDAVAASQKAPDVIRPAAVSGIHANHKAYWQKRDQPMMDGIKAVKTAQPGQDPMASINPADWAALPKRDQETITGIINPPEVDHDAYAKFHDALQENYRGLKGIGEGQFYRDYYSKMTTAHRDEALGIYQDLQSGKTNTAYSAKSLANSVIIRMNKAGQLADGIKKTTDMSDDEKGKFQAIGDYVNHQLNDTKTKERRTLTPTEANEMIDHAIKRVWEEHHFFGPNKYSVGPSPSDIEAYTGLFKKYNSSFDPNIGNNKQMIQNYIDAVNSNDMGKAASILNGVKK